MVVLLVALLSIALVLGYTRSSAELRTYTDQQATVDAGALAQTGLSQFLAGLTSLPASGSRDTTIVGLPSGSATVSLRRIRDSAGTAGDVWVAYVTGLATGSSRTGATVPIATRSIAQILVPPITTAKMNVLAAWVSLNGVTRSSPAGSFDGNDADHVSGYPNTVDPISTVTGGWVESSPTSSMHGGSVDYLGTSAQAYATAGVDWDAIINGGAVTPDYTRANCSGSWPSSPSYPIILVTGNCSITTSIDWKGTLIVMGDLTTTSSWQIHGLVLVGGNFNTSGSPQDWGAIISGLKRGVPSMTPQPSSADLSSGNAQYWYSSKDIKNAMARLVPASSAGVLVPTPNAWLDNWPGY
jgi:hypothetical protein